MTRINSGTGRPGLFGTVTHGSGQSTITQTQEINPNNGKEISTGLIANQLFHSHRPDQESGMIYMPGAPRHFEIESKVW
jgi:hypothetical protein